MSLVPFVQLEASLASARAGDEVPLSSDELHHLATVLRLGPGASIEVADGHGRSADAGFTGGGVALRGEPVERVRSRPAIEVAQALPKGRKLDEVVRQLTELDVDAVVPVATERSIVRLDGSKAHRAVERWRAVARAACEQSRRSDLPTIAPVASVDDLVELTCDEGTAVLVAHPGGAALAEHLDACRRAARVVVVVGPEGGLTDGELAVLTGAGARTLGLGPTTLRTEHAAAAATAALVCALGRWG